MRIICKTEYATMTGAYLYYNLIIKKDYVYYKEKKKYIVKREGQDDFEFMYRYKTKSNDFENRFYNLVRLIEKHKNFQAMYSVSDVGAIKLILDYDDKTKIQLEMNGFCIEGLDEIEESIKELLSICGIKTNWF